MRNGKFLYITLGFIAGVFYIAACGTGSNSGNISDSIAGTIINAADVLFDHTSSGLSASNVQSAIDEVNAKVQRNNLKSILEGATWTSRPAGESSPSGDTITFNEDGTYSCTYGTSGRSMIAQLGSVCAGPISWDAEKLGLVTLTHGSSPDVVSFYIFEASSTEALAMGLDGNPPWILTKK